MRKGELAMMPSAETCPLASLAGREVHVMRNSCYSHTPAYTFTECSREVFETCPGGDSRARGLVGQLEFEHFPTSKGGSVAKARSQSVCGCPATLWQRLRLLVVGQLCRSKINLGWHDMIANSELSSASTAERRQLTVMFCDLVGSTALAAHLDLEDVRELLTTYQRLATEIVESGGGRVARYQGDGVLAYFGYPTANEDDAEQAIRTGLELVKVVQELKSAPAKLRARVGVATGVVIVGDLIHSHVADNPPIVGDTANLAARLQEFAEPDTLVIASSTKSLLGDLFAYRDLGPKSLKGFAEPIRVWRVLGETAIRSRFEALRSHRTPLVGRDQEMELMLRRW